MNVKTFDCSRCGFEGKLLGGRLCERCTRSDGLTALLDGGTGHIHPALVPPFDLLVAMDQPRSGLARLEIRRGQPGNASQLLRRLGLGEIPLTHDAFQELQPWRGRRSPGRTPHDLRSPARGRQVPVFLPTLASRASGPHCRPRARQDDQALRDLACPSSAAGPRRAKPHHTQRPTVRRRADQVRDRIPAMARQAQQHPRVLRAERHRRLVGRNTEHSRTCLRAFLSWAMQSRRCRRTLSTNPASCWLFPGRRAGQPFRPDHLSALLNEVSGSQPPLPAVLPSDSNSSNCPAPS